MTISVPRRPTLAAVASIALLLPLAACGDSAVVAPAPGSTPSARSEPSGEPRRPGGSGHRAEAGPPAKTTAKFKPRPKPRTTTETPATALFGTQYAHLRSAGGNRLTFDLVQYFEGDAASRACDADDVPAGEGVRCVDFYIRNTNPRLRTLGADPAGPYRLLTDDGPVEVGLGAFIAALRGTDRVFRFSVDGGRILDGDEVPA